MTTSSRVTELGTNCEIAALARHYCDLIRKAADDGAWLKAVADLLPRLHAAIASVEADCSCIDHSDPVDLDARFERFTILRGLLGDRDSYWLEFDSAAEGLNAMTGSLADDLTDIYSELEQGLRLFDLDPEYALAVWTSGYEHHWGRHLIDAERHLVTLGAQSRLDL
ncbi:DUF5063 domain-containing protein [Thiorhodococcus mannitoliphagus]|uniref:DUF5063 domain-containing protein n=1 Tax=Thiorhodococcus mannitoliphagus TaxID=329406 RepID=A0A6P1E099_9GAMM|nr:DUF5063 domain-containing protein [Thiorhodococcus mannitoliphagus]NEX21195.1 DUF5063 domain-containing protein [Thiorhodococcus mannitoliphagus]